MAERRTNTDAIRDLEVSAAVQRTEIVHLRHGLDRSFDQHGDALANVNALRSDVSVLQHRVGELERLQRHRAQYLWALFGIVIGGVLSFAGSVVLRLIPPR